MELEYVYTPDKLQTYNVLNKFLNDRDIQENLIVISGDIITNLHLKDLISFH
jgi:NDP-sugar pyrophosphorylase family protein